MIDWSQTEKYYDLGNTAGFAMSMLEAERILRALLDEKKIKGADYEKKIEQVSQYLSAPNNFQHARALVLQLVNLELPKTISKQTTEKILQTYFTAAHEIQNLSAGKIRKLNWLSSLHNLKKHFFIFSTVLVAALLGIAGLSLFLTESAAGQEIAEFINKYSRIIFYKALPLLLIILTIGAIGIGLSMKSLHKKHKKQKTNQEHASITSEHEVR